LSAHGDQSKLLNWLGTCKKVKKIFCVHGEDDALTTFADKIKSELKKEAHIAKYDEVVKV